MSIDRALANNIIDETLWFKTTLALTLTEFNYYLIKKNGQISCNFSSLCDQHYTNLYKQFQALSLQHSTIEILPLNDDGKTSWALPFGKDSSLFDCIILLDLPANVESHHVSALYFKLLYQLKSFQFSEASSQLNAAQVWIRDEIEEITRLQQLMLPDKGIELSSVKMAYTYKAMKGAGGDYLDIVDLGKSRPDIQGDIGMIIADVSGHGPAAAVETAMIDAILRTFEPKNLSSSSSEVLNYINQHFFTKKPRGSFLTATVLRYNCKDKELIYANAGHPHAYLKKANRLVALDQGGIPIGVLREQNWDTYRVSVDVGDILFVYTDVVIETQNAQKELFGFDRLEKAISAAPDEPEAMLEYLEQQMKLFCGFSEFQDDLTMCAIQFI
ncbi:serine/threonine-protein phosphatase [Shewanella sp. SR43-4]|uniref:PP2C family protein-serine/threonine phosphatase n=1 Tax=Shewanella vesiculosa TaxID=518738 RepID=A0ABV0FR79_9GAMM|nr:MULTISPECIES: PP2C family protein-serine/threonine phosphatase [Shewanella]NCQ45118.1 serine/threonine-protein phosphatase [Shewanella frigidimarina]MBB1316447.1 serine/threonine-protein phosphatase [Shewanella sp. SR43-4]MBB1323189.1 serine/threonine-protein phosphatase [Shewanella sp. SR43-8]MBB1475575.1 serine/threonine-protein phosphatase [Shewanella sp. SG41-3]NCO70894.1 serine/threonine-protein phosphatase [Shewanella vesiculosa]